MNEVLLELSDIKKEFASGQETLCILDGVNLKICRGETIAVTGPSGSGKSTLLGLMAGLERPTRGKISFAGDAIQNWDEDRLAAWRREKVGFIFQNFRLIKILTALENVSLPLEILGHGACEARERARELLSELALENRVDHLPSQLSGGEQQRVAIARAYVHQPQIIFADEPSGSLDPATAEKVLESLLDFNRRRESALVVVTHDLEIAARLQRNYCLAGGTVA